VSGKSAISKSDRAMIVSLKEQVVRYRQLARVAAANHREQLNVKDQQIVALTNTINSHLNTIETLTTTILKLTESSNKERLALINTLQMQYDQGINTTHTAARAHFYQTVDESAAEMLSKYDHHVPEDVKQDVFNQMDRMEQYDLEKLKHYCWELSFWVNVQKLKYVHMAIYAANAMLNKNQVTAKQQIRQCLHLSKQY
jgi:hypothetical protein